MSKPGPTENLAIFLAHSVALEEEAAEQHDELADMMDVHHNTEVAAVFRKLAHYSRLHAQEVREHAQGQELPRFAPWEFDWGEQSSPEAGGIDGAHYLMTTRHALRLAMKNERRAYDFYHLISQNSPDPEVRDLAAEFAEEEKGHMDLLEKWLEATPDSANEARFDMDPPHVPE
ncbi:ferritin-like domain-containing protein [Elongatibacter sediminis]|uniref:Ferritin family protein n=1 Tax=Elongatibacter sediminis TaxID=3119006 RepID=A0AAW9RHL6_9GAMM